jgi:hypothetical protein
METYRCARWESRRGASVMLAVVFAVVLGETAAYGNVLGWIALLLITCQFGVAAVADAFGSITLESSSFRLRGWEVATIPYDDIAFVSPIPRGSTRPRRSILEPSVHIELKRPRLVLCFCPKHYFGIPVPLPIRSIDITLFDEDVEPFLLAFSSKRRAIET